MNIRVRDDVVVNNLFLDRKIVSVKLIQNRLSLRQLNSVTLDIRDVKSDA